MQFKLFSSKISLVNTLFYVLLSTFFLQTRFAPFARHEVVDYLIPFVYLSDALIVLLLAGSFRSLKSLRSRKLVFQFFSFSVFLFSTVISNLSAIHPVSAWYHWFKLLGFGAFAFWVAWYIKQKKIFNFQFSIFNFLSLGLVFVCLVAIGEFIFQRSLGLQILGEWRFSVLTPGIAKVILFGKEYLRPYATFPHPNVLGGILSIMAPVNLYLALGGRGKKGNRGENHQPACTGRPPTTYHLPPTINPLPITYYILFTITLFLTFSRSAWLAYGVLMMVVLGFWGGKVSVRQLADREFRGLRKLLVPALLLALCSLLFAVPFVYQRVKSLQTTDVLSIERRVELSRAAIAMFADHPLFGVGLGNFIPNLEKYLVVSGQGRFLQPVHNVPLLILAETGIVGFTTFFVFIAVLLYNFVRRVKTEKEFCTLHFALCTLLMWIGIFVLSLFDHYFWTLQAGQLFFWLTVGLTLSCPPNQRT